MFCIKGNDFVQSNPHARGKNFEAHAHILSQKNTWLNGSITWVQWLEQKRALNIFLQKDDSWHTNVLWASMLFLCNKVNGIWNTIYELKSRPLFKSFYTCVYMGAINHLPSKLVIIYFWRISWGTSSSSLACASI